MKAKYVGSLVAVCLLVLTACGTQQNLPLEKQESNITETVETDESKKTEFSSEGEVATEREFTDSVGRTVTLPVQLDRVAVTGPTGQIIVFALCPEKLVGLAEAWSPQAEQFLQPQYESLPVLRQLYGGKGEINLETLLSYQTQLVIDVGEPKKTTAEDLNGLQEQTGIPFVHIRANTEGMGDCYRKLGELFGCEQQAETLANYCEEKLQQMQQLMEQVEKKTLVYCLGDKGLNVIANGSFHGEVMDMMADNLAVVDQPSSRGTGNEVDIEQLMLWDPEVILFAPDSIYDTVGQEPVWQSLQAISSGNYYQVPFGPHNWMGFPPSVQKYLGMYWLGKVLYPSEADYDLYEEVKEYFSLFYHCELTPEQFQKLIGE